MSIELSASRYGESAVEEFRAFNHSAQKELRSLLDNQSLVPVDEWMAVITRTFYDNFPTYDDFFKTPPVFFPDIGACYARYAAQQYEQDGYPDPFTVLSAGEGKGQALFSFVRETLRYPQLAEHVSICVIDQSLKLIQDQMYRLEKLGISGDFIRTHIRWIHGDILTCDMPDLPHGMSILMELLDDMRFKSAVRLQDGTFREHFLTREGESVTEIFAAPSGELSGILEDPRYRDWLNRFPVGTPFPVPTGSRTVLERIISKMGHGTLHVVDYGFDLAEKPYPYSYPSGLPYRSNIMNGYRLQHASLPFAGLYPYAGLVNLTRDEDFLFAGLTLQGSVRSVSTSSLGDFLTANGAGAVIAEATQDMDPYDRWEYEMEAGSAFRPVYRSVIYSK